LEQAHWPSPPRAKDLQPAENSRERVPLSALVTLWIVITLMLGFVAYAVIAGSVWGEFKESDWVPTVIARIDHADELRRAHNPEAAIKEYEQIREFVGDRKFESRELRTRLVEMNWSWLEAERDIRRASTQP
jgi:hypothetical protein